MGALTYGLIEGGAQGWRAPLVMGALILAVVALVTFLRGAGARRAPDGAPGAVPFAAGGRFGIRRLHVHYRLLWPGVPAQPVLPASAGALATRDGSGVYTDDCTDVSGDAPDSASRGP